METQITISSSEVRRVLTGVVTALITAGFLAEVWIAFVNHDNSGPVTEFFSLSYERNLSTWASSCLLFSCALLLTVVASARRRAGAPFQAHWWGLAGGFFYISLDELVQIHEMLNSRLKFGGALYFGWVVPASILVVGLAIAYAPFVRDLSNDVRGKFLLAATIYVGGALGTEFPLGYWTSIAGDQNFTYAMIDLVQESMELTGVSVFLVSLVRFFEALIEAPQISLTPPEAVQDLSHTPARMEWHSHAS
jgi:hypothetical protein